MADSQARTVKLSPEVVDAIQKLANQLKVSFDQALSEVITTGLFVRQQSAQEGDARILAERGGMLMRIFSGLTSCAQCTAELTTPQNSRR